MKVNDEDLPSDARSRENKIEGIRDIVKQKYIPCKLVTLSDGSQSVCFPDEIYEERPKNLIPKCNNATKIKMPYYNLYPWAYPRPGKKLIVLDLEQTVCDFGPNPTDNPKFDERRPHLTKFLNSVYEFYDIVVWSATETSDVLNNIHRLKLFGERSKIWFYLGIDSMQKIKLRLNNQRKEAIVKSLESVWRRASFFTSKNTLMIDDTAQNFILDPKNGLKIKPYCKDNFKKDNELIFLSKYLINLAKHCNDFTIVNHRNWKLCQFKK